MSANETSYEGLKPKLIVAFEVGTTFSSVAYALLEPGKAPAIKTVNRWPGQEAGDSKVPTVLYYNTNGRVLAIGADMPPEPEGYGGSYDDSDLDCDEWDSNEPSHKVERFNLLLHPKSTTIDAWIPHTVLPPAKTICDVYADFYQYLFQCTCKHIKETHPSGTLLWEIVSEDIELTLILPNGWGEPQRSLMRTAAICAGLVRNTPTGHEHIKFVSEGEALIHFGVSSGALAGKAVEVPSKIMLIDAGDGVVNISTYSIEGAAPLELNPISSPSCILEGSCVIVQRMRNLLKGRLARSKFGEESYIEAITHEFQKTVMKRFKGTGDCLVRFSAMASSTDANVGISHGRCKLTNEEISNCFDPSVREIIAAIEDQRRLAGCSVPVYVLSGSFASNEYLYHKLKLYVESVCNQTLYRPDANTNKAAAEGAVAFHIDHHVMTRTAKFTYGFRCPHVYDHNRPDHVQRANKVTISRCGLEMLRDGFQPLLFKQGTRVREEVSFEYPFHAASRFGANQIEVEIICYNGDRAPVWMDEDPKRFATVEKIVIDASRIPRVPQHGTSCDYYHQHYTVMLSFDLTEIKVYLTWMEKGVKHESQAYIIPEYPSANLNSAVVVAG
ncbi:hypothetical protein PENSPDRAFT_621609 [Peniophora sp. CONT]|nr:hypothetical protein PENSPDRAFT_621609 [Peniophora sp. CONT]